MRSSLLHSSAAAQVVLNALYLVWVGSEVWIRASRPRPTGHAQSRRTGPLILVGVLAALSAATALASHNAGPPIVAGSWAVFAVGIAVAVLGIALRLWAVMTLGRFFQLVVVIQEGHRVVTSGPYRLIRHPSYAGALLTLAGIGIALDNWLSLALCLVVPLAAILPRIVVEERALTEGLGDDYRQYQRGTARLVPGVW